MSTQPIFNKRVFNNVCTESLEDCVEILSVDTTVVEKVEHKIELEQLKKIFETISESIEDAFHFARVD